ncbi:enoyl-CoA hydratase-related protein [Evansella sp. LMS18]|uniref:enoyl-CoA hydratase/isomerase family protein n=1 Tax=Evansella sp. LMS18 TaxID=2924033 RepID=UPI0020D131CB|nr:enoyl-CoA hydratase-related protein [Evansella sp. LMS18]UTR12262.1 enoyl-CoA hydratase-related protein [Evansella sp. LMS18]
MSLKNETVLYEVKDNIATIKMNRPHVKNALNLAMHEELYDAFQEARQDNEVKVIILTGAEGAFSSGADLKSFPIEDMEKFDHGEYLEKTYNSLVLLIDEIEKPVIAYINGIAVGAGLSLALACDFRFAESEAKFGLSFLQIGLTPDAGASYFLPRLVGLGKAMEIALGETFTAEEAYKTGLITKIGHPGEVAEKLKRAPFPAYSWMKQNMKTGTQSDLRATLDAEVEGQRSAGKSEDHLQAVKRFLSR